MEFGEEARVSDLGCEHHLGDSNRHVKEFEARRLVQKGRDGNREAVRIVVMDVDGSGERSEEGSGGRR